MHISIDGCLLIQPIIIFGLFGKIASTKIDSRWCDLYILRSFLGWHKYFLIYKRAPPADDSVGVCSITLSFRFMLVVGVIPFINLDSAMPIKSNSVWSWLIKCLKLSNCLGRKPTFRWNNEELHFSYLWLYD